MVTRFRVDGQYVYIVGDIMVVVDQDFENFWGIGGYGDWNRGYIFTNSHTPLGAYCRHCDNLPLSGISHLWSASRRFIFLIVRSLAISCFIASLAKSSHKSTTSRHRKRRGSGPPRVNYEELETRRVFTIQSPR